VNLFLSQFGQAIQIFFPSRTFSTAWSVLIFRQIRFLFCSCSAVPVVTLSPPFSFPWFCVAATGLSSRFFVRPTIPAVVHGWGRFTVLAIATDFAFFHTRANCAPPSSSPARSAQLQLWVLVLRPANPVSSLNQTFEFI
jgi:hypothetical protein